MQPIDVTYEKLDGQQARPFAGELQELYAEVYAEPPYHEGPSHVAQFARWLADELGKPGFTLATARNCDSVLMGAAYGFTLPPGEWMEPKGAAPPADIQDAPKFNVAEWMVRAPYRGQGVGGRLMDLVLSDRSEPWAILASNPAADARRIYERWGWVQHGQIAPKTMPAMDVLVLSLTAVR
jgi:GNAT superfamily N-acetyltransferase